MFKYLAAATFAAAGFFIASAPANAISGYTNPSCFFHVNKYLLGEALEMNRKDELQYVGAQFNDKISSVKCERGCSATAYTAIGFGGASRTFVGTTNTLSKTFGDNISSIKVVCVRQRAR